MKKLVFLLLYLAATSKSFGQEYKWQNITVDIKIKSSFRALSVVDDNVVWMSGSKGWIGRSRDGGKAWSFQQIKAFEGLDFRSIYAFDSLTAIVANVGSPAHIFRTTDGGKTWRSVYQNDNKDAFIDGLDFWNNKKGMAYGDPIDGKMLLVSTQDEGLTWKELPAPDPCSRREEKSPQTSRAQGTGRQSHHCRWGSP